MPPRDYVPLTLPGVVLLVMVLHHRRFLPFHAQTRGGAYQHGKVNMVNIKGSLARSGNSSSIA
jgi:hypothetical protein